MPVIEYGEGRHPQSGFVAWIAGAPSRSLNAFAIAAALACLWGDADIIEAPTRALVAAGVWAIISIVWITKVLIAAEDSSPGEVARERSIRPKWAVIPAMLLVVAVAYAGNLPLLAAFWINQRGLQQLSVGRGVAAHSPVGQTFSYTIQSIQTDGPRVSLLVGGVNGVDDRKFGFQHVADGAAPRYPNAQKFLPMGSGWYAFSADRPVGLLP